MPKAYLEITPGLITGLCKGLKPGGEKRYFHVVDNALPTDTKCVEVSPYNGHTLILTLESKYFIEGNVLPEPQLIAVYGPQEIPDDS